MNYGYQNEYDFVEFFNDKYLQDFDSNSQKFLQEIFENNIGNEEKIKAWKNKMNQKADFFIRYRNYIKNVSLKCGNSNSVHHENIQNFRRYLEKLKIPYKIINIYVNYHYGYNRDENGMIDYSVAYSAEEYKRVFQNEIDLFNKYINKTRIIVDMIDRFIVRGTNSDYDIDAFVSGTIDDYVWILKHDIYDLILSKKNKYFSSPHISCMTLGPQKRNLNRNSSNAKDRYLVCARWNFIKEDIIAFKKENNL